MLQAGEGIVGYRTERAACLAPTGVGRRTPAPGQSAESTDARSGLKTGAIKKPLTVHAWGGACFGPTLERGVIDHRGEVYGNRGLFVADAAALPAAAGTPPSLAIAAWARHVADGPASKAI
ncbi:MAG: GMC oxidoreductase [Myxococcaceae bacterium]